MLDEAVFETVEGDDGEASADAKGVRCDDEEALELTELVVDGYPQGLEDAGSGVDAPAAGDGVGDEVRVEFSLRGREWKSPQGDIRYFNSLDVWTLESATGASRNDEQPPLPDAPPPEPGDDIPF